MDKRLEKIRHFEANVMDFESYINDRIKQTKAENQSKDMNEALCPLCKEFGFEATENIPEECLNYVAAQVDNFEQIYNLALDKINHYRSSLEYADPELYSQIIDAIREWRYDSGLPEMELQDEIEEIFVNNKIHNL